MAVIATLQLMGSRLERAVVVETVTKVLTEEVIDRVADASRKKGRCTGRVQQPF